VSYVIAGYAITFGSIAGYALRVRWRTRSLQRALREERG